MDCIICNHKSDFLFYKSQFQFYKCNYCGIVFVNPKQIKKNNNQQYSDNKSSPLEYYRLIEQYDQRSFLKRIRLLDKYFPHKGSILEIGSNTGTFLKLAHSLGWDIEGIEPNNATCKSFLASNKSIKVYNSFFNSKFVYKHKKKYDIIYSSDVIEHIQDPVQFLKDATKLLNPNGLIVIITPDFNNILTKLFQIKPTEHLVYFNRSNIAKAYELSGLKIISLSNSHRYRNINAMLYSTTFTDSNNSGSLMSLVKLINFLKLNFIVEIFLNLFKEDLMIIGKKR